MLKTLLNNISLQLVNLEGLKNEDKVLEDYVSILELRLQYNNIIVTEDGDYFEKVEDKSNKDA